MPFLCNRLNMLALAEIKLLCFWFRYVLTLRLRLAIPSAFSTSNNELTTNSSLNIALDQKLLNWPENGVCVGDDAFPLRKNLLKPFSKRKLSLEEKVLTTVCEEQGV